MSTYLVAFIVADFISVSNNVSKTTVCVLLKVLFYIYCGNMLHYVFVFFPNAVQVSVYAVPDKKEQVQYALDTACKTAEILQYVLWERLPVKQAG